MAQARLHQGARAQCRLASGHVPAVEAPGLSSARRLPAAVRCCCSWWLLLALTADKCLSLARAVMGSDHCPVGLTLRLADLPELSKAPSPVEDEEDEDSRENTP